MRKILFIVMLFVSMATFAQGGPIVDAIKFQNKMTTTARNAWTVPTGQRPIIWNITTEQLEQWNGTAWSALGAVQSVAGKVGAVTLVKGDVGLANVDNTTDLNKPVSTATQTALNAKQATLVSGSNIKTVNGTSIVGGGNITTPDSQTATQVPSTPNGNLIATNVQSALVELQTELDTKGIGNAVTSGNLSQFASTTSAQLATLISDEAGSGSLVFSESPTITNANLGTPTTITLTNATGLTSTGILNGTILDADINASAAIAASKLANTPSGNLAATTVQGALNELQSDVDLKGLAKSNQVLTNGTTRLVSLTDGFGGTASISFNSFYDELFRIKGNADGSGDVEIFDNDNVLGGGAVYVNLLESIAQLNKKIITEEVTTTTYTPVRADLYKIKEMNNAAAVRVYAPTGSYVAGENMSFQQTGAGKVEFNFVDAITNSNLRTTGIGAAAQIRYTGSGWSFMGNLESYSPATAITYSAPEYDFNAQLLSTGALASWANSGTGIATAATQGTGANQPTVIDESGKKAVSFDGVNDVLTLGTPADLDYVMGTDVFTIIIVRGSTVATTGTIFGDRDGIDRNYNIGATANNNFLVQLGENGQFFETVATTGRVILEIKNNGATADTYNNGVISQTGTTVTSETVAQNTFNIGARGNGSSYYNGSIRRILVWNRLLTTQERTDIVAQLQSEN